MSFVSYAQNFEDVVLWRALKDIDAGFYVDVGAFDPSLDSVTRAFYERGWRGINIDAADDLMKAFEVERPEDINLAVAVGDRTGELVFHRVIQTGLSTLDAEAAARFRADGWSVEERRVQVETLDAILERHCRGPIHFLKIDVEGAERAVLSGLDLARWRPWILAIEATAALSETPVFDAWENLVTERGYAFVYFDGLNRFYVAREHSERGARLAVPPNVFDRFRRADEVRLERERDSVRAEMTSETARLAQALEEAERKFALQSVQHAERLQEMLERVVAADKVRDTAWAESIRLGKSLNYAVDRSRLLESELERVKESLEAMRLDGDGARAELDAMRRSVSWRVTRPLRALRRVIASS